MVKVLEMLKDQAINQVDFFNAVLASGYGASMSKIDYEYQKQQKVSQGKKFQLQNLKSRKRRFQKFISKMKQDGLICEIDGDNFAISAKGKVKLVKLKNNLPGRHYEKENQNNPVIISFDVPERLRRKRNWLREVIKNLGFEMIHQSVWIGKVKIPQDMIVDLENLKILEYVEIFEISKKGTLQKL